MGSWWEDVSRVFFFLLLRGVDALYSTVTPTSSAFHHAPAGARGPNGGALMGRNDVERLGAVRHSNWLKIGLVACIVTFSGTDGSNATEHHQDTPMSLGLGTCSAVQESTGRRGSC